MGAREKHPAFFYMAPADIVSYNALCYWTDQFDKDTMMDFAL
jgi:hypothetical protein